jgi:hypothetical protein
MAAIVHGWCGYVEKSNDVVFQQMVINKMWIPDDMINEIKDYLYIDSTEVLRRFYKQYLNRSITDMSVTNHTLVDIYGRSRMAVWQTGYIYGGGDLNLQGAICVTCGDCWQLHNNANNCCALEWDTEDEPLQLVGEDAFDMEVQDETIEEINAEADEDDDDDIPEVSWDIDIPVASYDFQQAQAVLNALQQAEAEVAREQIEDAVWGRQPEEQYDFDYDMESEMADYAEYQREVEMEAYSDRYGR